MHFHCNVKTDIFYLNDWRVSKCKTNLKMTIKMVNISENTWPIWLFEIKKNISIKTYLYKQTKTNVLPPLFCPHWLQCYKSTAHSICGITVSMILHIMIIHVHLLTWSIPHCGVQYMDQTGCELFKRTSKILALYRFRNYKKLNLKNNTVQPLEVVIIQTCQSHKQLENAH